MLYFKEKCVEYPTDSSFAEIYKYDLKSENRCLFHITPETKKKG